MANDGQTTLRDALVLFLKDPSGVFAVLNGALTDAFGNASIGDATKSQVMGQWNAQVFANVDLSAGEWLSQYPQVTLYRNNDPVSVPTEMSQPVQGVNLWVADVIAVYPEPTFAKLEVQFMDESYTTTTVTDVKPLE